LGSLGNRLRNAVDDLTQSPAGLTLNTDAIGQPLEVRIVHTNCNVLHRIDEVTTQVVLVDDAGEFLAHRRIDLLRHGADAASNVHAGLQGCTEQTQRLRQLSSELGTPPILLDPYPH